LLQNLTVFKYSIRLYSITNMWNTRCKILMYLALHVNEIINRRIYGNAVENS